MKLVLSFVVISVLALSQAFVLKEPTSDNLDQESVQPTANLNQGSIQTRANLIQGSIQPGDKLLNRLEIQQQAKPNEVWTQTSTISGNYIISYVSAREVGHTQFPNAWVVSGGVGHNHVAIRTQSSRGWGFHLYIEVWGRENVV